MKFYKFNSNKILDKIFYFNNSPNLSFKTMQFTLEEFKLLSKVTLPHNISPSKNALKRELYKYLCWGDSKSAKKIPQTHEIRLMPLSP